MKNLFYQLYKSELRGVIETGQRKSFITFNADQYFDESRKPIEILQQFSEHYLSEDKQISCENANHTFILIPIEGELKIQSANESFSLSPQHVFLSDSQQIQITNEYLTKLSRFYVIQLKELHIETKIVSFDTEQKNQLLSILETDSFDFKLGVYSGREDEKYHSRFENNFITVVNGAFEFENRLMETNDSLFVKGQQCLEFEALSEYAILFILSF